MNTCNNCKFWGDGLKPDNNKSNACGEIGLADPTSKDIAFIDVSVSDDSGLHANFMTIASFSCSLFKPKQ